MNIKISRTSKMVKVESDKLSKPRHFKYAARALEFAISLTDKSMPIIEWDDREPVEASP